ncbi:MAG: recombinase family protein [SAR324 cluster bacterium]|nr:recombinase family protein [SAR324 cluster bacterium]
MSEVELHLMRARLYGGTLNKAARGELKLRLPIGLVYDLKDKVVLDPDSQVAHSLRLFFKTYRRTGSVHRTVKEFAQKKIPFPRREHSGPYKGEVVWGSLTHSRANYILHNPRYTGAFVFMRRKHVLKTLDGKYDIKWLPQDQWHTLIKSAHEGYISFQEYEENQERLQKNRIKNSGPNYPPREGNALLQGIVFCGKCGRKMTVRYTKQADGLKPRYECPGQGHIFCEPTCQSIAGRSIDEAIGKLLVETMSPLALEVTLAVQKELQERIEETDALRLKQVQRIGYEIDLARKRYMNVDPENRLVADELEADWNTQLIAYREAKSEYKRKREKDLEVLDDQTKARILELTTDFKKLWNDPKTPARDRKRMIRLLIEDVMLIRSKEGLTLKIRFKGGAFRVLQLPNPKSSWELGKTDQKTVQQIDRLLSEHTYLEIAAILNESGVLSGQGNVFDSRRVNKTRLAYGLKNRYQRLREQGYLTAKEAACKLGLSSSGLRARRIEGRLKLKAVKVNDFGQHLYEDPDKIIVAAQG